MTRCIQVQNKMKCKSVVCSTYLHTLSKHSWQPLEISPSWRVTCTDSASPNNNFNILENPYDQNILLFRTKETNFRINLKQTVYTFVFAPQDTLFQLYQEIYIKCWTTSMNRVAFKLLVIKQTVLHFFIPDNLFAWLMDGLHYNELHEPSFQLAVYTCENIFQRNLQKFEILRLSILYFLSLESLKQMKFELPFQLPYPEA